MFITCTQLGARGWRWAAIVLPLVLLALLVALTPREGDAHAFLEDSHPQANSVLPEPPAQAHLWFTEPLEPDYTRAELFDAAGNRVETGESIVDGNQLFLNLPADLALGTYTIQWRNISTADGHPEQGYIPFTIGSRDNVVAPVIPEQTEFNPPPRWLDATGRWLSLLGLTGAVGAIACWVWVLRRSLDPLDDATFERVAGRVSLSVYIWIAIAIAGSLIALGVQAAATGDGLSLATVLDVLQDTRFGQLWIARVVLLVGLLAAAASASLWDEQPPQPIVVLAEVLAGGAIMTFALNSHAAAPGIGRAAAIVVDWLHLAASSIWVGGLLALLIALVYGTRGAPGQQRREAFALAIARFTTLALASIVVLSLTGFYSAWLEVGNLTALVETSYGQTLIVKLALVAVMLVLGALNMLVLGPRMLSAARSGVRFGRSIAAEALLGVGVLFAVGILTGLPTAREALSAEVETTSFHFTENDVHAALYISPGATGFNRYTADVAIDGQATPAGAVVLLRLEKEGDVEGLREIPLTYLSGSRFEASGSELSVAGDWAIELIVRRESQADARFQDTMDVPQTPPAAKLPGPPPRFGGAASAVAILFAGFALASLVISLRAPAQQADRATSIGFAVALLLAGVVILSVNRESESEAVAATNPIPQTAESIEAGRQVFAENCAGCHGDDGTGYGPAAASLSRPPADLTAAHVGAHADGDLQWWITNGIAPDMPGFAGQLSEEEVWNVINYVRSLRGPAQAASQTTIPTPSGGTPAACAALPAEDVQAATGQQPRPGEMVNPEGAEFCLWWVGEGDGARIITYRDLNGSGRLEAERPVEAVAVADLGDDAYWVPSVGTLIVRTSEGGFSIQVSTANPDNQLPRSGQLLETAVTLADGVLLRLGAGS